MTSSRLARGISGPLPSSPPGPTRWAARSHTSWPCPRPARSPTGTGPWPAHSASRPCRPDRTRLRPRSTPRPWWPSTSARRSRARSPCPVAAAPGHAAPGHAAPGHAGPGRPAGPAAAPRPVRADRAPVHGGRTRRPAVPRAGQHAGPRGTAAECPESAGCLRTAGAAGRFRAATNPQSGPAPAGRPGAAGPAGHARARACRASRAMPGQHACRAQGMGQPGMGGQQGMSGQSGAARHARPAGHLRPEQGVSTASRACPASRWPRSPTRQQSLPAQGMPGPPERQRPAVRARPVHARASPCRARACRASPCRARACPASRACPACTRHRLHPRPRRPPACRTRGFAAPTPSPRRPSRTLTRHRPPRSAGPPRTSRPGRTSRGPTACCPRSR